ncbi:MAG: hypothetical protein WC802_00425 [Patescibacteria group bacterium]|jgi:hypothetical protein
MDKDAAKETIKKPIYRRWWFWLLAFLAFVMIVGPFLPESTTTPSPVVVSSGTGSDTINVDKPTPAPEPEKVVATTSAVKFYQDYTTNNIAAEQKYNGHLVKLTGVISSIGRDILGKAYIVLKGDQYGFKGIQCMLDDSSMAKVAEVSIGDSVTLTGRVKDNVLTNILIDGCLID